MEPKDLEKELPVEKLHPAEEETFEQVELDDGDSDEESQPVTLWTREEDRQILMAAKSASLSLESTSVIWQGLVNSGAITKTISQIGERYEQLILLFKNQLRQGNV
jgi:hypothetical protein